MQQLNKIIQLLFLLCFFLASVSEAEINELKQIPELSIDWDKLKPRTKEEISKREATYTEAKQYNVSAMHH